MAIPPLAQSASKIIAATSDIILILILITSKNYWF